MIVGFFFFQQSPSTSGLKIPLSVSMSDAFRHLQYQLKLQKNGCIAFKWCWHSWVLAFFFFFFNGLGDTFVTFFIFKKQFIYSHALRLTQPFIFFQNWPLNYSRFCFFWRLIFWQRHNCTNNYPLWDFSVLTSLSSSHWLGLLCTESSCKDEAQIQQLEGAGAEYGLGLWGVHWGKALVSVFHST